MTSRVRLVLACALAALAAALMLVPIDTLKLWLAVPDSVDSGTTIGLGDMTVSTAVHVALFGVLGLALPWLWPRRATWLRLLAGLALALGFELLQLLTDARVAKWEDAATNVVSVLVGLLLGTWLAPRFANRSVVDSVP